MSGPSSAPPFPTGSPEISDIGRVENLVLPYAQAPFLGDLWINPLQYSQGMLLLPQHLQYLTQHLFQIQCERLRAIQPFFWGVLEMEVDSLSLLNGVFRLTRLRSIFPDGLLAVLPENTPLSVDLSPLRTELQAPFSKATIYAQVPEVRATGPDVGGAFPRYKAADSQPFVDFSSGEDPQSLPILIPNISLTTECPNSMYTAFPLAQVTFENSGFRLAPFIPPLLHVSQSAPLGRAIRQVLKILWEKSSYLSNTLQSPLLDAVPEVTKRYRHILSVIAPPLPVLEAQLSTNATHPFILFQSLCGLAGALINLKLGQLPPLFPPYNHNDIFTSFDPVIAFIMEMVELIQQTYTSLPFTRSDRVFSLLITPQWVKRGSLTIAVREGAATTPESLAQWAKNAIIASKSRLRGVRERRVLGAGRNIVGADSQLGVSAPPFGVLLSLSIDPAFIAAGEELCIFNLSDTPDSRPSEILLYAPTESR